MKRKKLRSFIIISVLLHIALISAAAIIYKGDTSISFSKIFEISIIKIYPEKPHTNTAQKPDVINPEPIKKTVAKKSPPKKIKVNPAENQKKEISKKPKQTYTEQNSMTDEINIAAIKITDKKQNTNQLSNFNNVTHIAYPDYKSNPKPDYPMIARRRGYEGTVQLRVYVLENGKTGRVEIEKSSNYKILDRSALDAVGKWRFIPGRKNGVPVASWVTVPIKFRLTNT